MIGKIYKIINNINNKIYIGCTIKETIEERFCEHKSRLKSYKYKSKLYNSFKKYGIDNFSIELIEECDLKEIYNREKYYINFYNTYIDGLNSTLGGDGTIGYKHPDWIIKKIIKSLIENGNSHKGKTYEELYGENCEKEKEQRSKSVKKSWDSLDIKDKKNRLNKIKNEANKNRKYDVNLISEIKRNFNNGINVKDIHLLYPEISIYYLYDLKSGRRGGSLN
jgi:group I intron endonuclease